METFYEKRKKIAGACAVILAATLLLSGGAAYYHAYWNVTLSEPDWGDRVPYVMDNGNMVMQYQNVCIVEKLLDEHTSMCMAVQWLPGEDRILDLANSFAKTARRIKRSDVSGAVRYRVTWGETEYSKTGESNEYELTFSKNRSLQQLTIGDDHVAINGACLAYSDADEQIAALISMLEESFRTDGIYGPSCVSQYAEIPVYRYVS